MIFFARSTRYLYMIWHLCDFSDEIGTLRLSRMNENVEVFPVIRTYSIQIRSVEFDSSLFVCNLYVSVDCRLEHVLYSMVAIANDVYITLHINRTAYCLFHLFSISITWLISIQYNELTS